MLEKFLLLTFIGFIGNWRLQRAQRKKEQHMEKFYRFELEEVQTLMLPSGWLQFIYTPEDSIVVGGNYLDEEYLELNIIMTKVEDECVKGSILKVNLFPHFWVIVYALIEFFVNPELQEDNMSTSMVPSNGKYEDLEDGEIVDSVGEGLEGRGVVDTEDNELHYEEISDDEIVPMEYEDLEEVEIVDREGEEMEEGEIVDSEGEEFEEGEIVDTDDDELHYDEISDDEIVPTEVVDVLKKMSDKKAGQLKAKCLIDLPIISTADGVVWSVHRRSASQNGIIFCKKYGTFIPRRLFGRKVKMYLGKMVNDSWIDAPNYSPHTGFVVPDESYRKVLVILGQKNFFQNGVHKDFPTGEHFRFEMLNTFVTPTDKSVVLLCDVVRETKFGKEEKESIRDIPNDEQSAAYQDLDNKQQTAVYMAENVNRPIVCIEGAPGTGKTWTLAHYIWRNGQMKTRIPGKKVLVLAPNLSSLQTIMERTKFLFEKHGTEFHFSNEEKFFKDIGRKSIYESITRKWKFHKQEYFHAKISKTIRDQKKSCMLREYHIENYEKELKNRMKNCNIFFSFIDSPFLGWFTKELNPEICIIENAGLVHHIQDIPFCLINCRFLLAGDRRANKTKTTVLQHTYIPSIIDFLWAQKKNYSWIRLENQYRCHPDIFRWSMKELYQSELFKNKTHGNHTLRGLITKEFCEKHKGLNMRSFEPFVVFDTVQQIEKERAHLTYERVIESFNEERNHETQTFKNLYEAEVVIKHYKNLLDLGLHPETIAIITQPAGQVQLLRERIDNMKLGISATRIVGPLDDFHGREYDAVIFSLVLNNPQRQMRGIWSVERFHSIITKAKKHFAMVGSTHMLSAKQLPALHSLKQIWMGTNCLIHPHDVFNEHNHIFPNLMSNFGEDFCHFKAMNNNSNRKENAVTSNENRDKDKETCSEDVGWWASKAAKEEDMRQYLKKSSL